MTDILIRDVPEDVLVAIDAAATELGLSRSDYLRRVLARERRARSTVTAGDLGEFSSKFSDLADTDVIGQAWK